MAGGIKNISKIGKALLHTTEDGTKTIVKHPNAPPITFHSDIGNSRQLANEVSLGAPKEFMPGGTGLSTKDAASMVERSLEDTNVLPNVVDAAKNVDPSKIQIAPGIKSGAAASSAALLSGDSKSILGAGYEDLKKAAQLYRKHVADPITDAAKKRLTPTFKAGSETVDTSSPISDLVVEAGLDPMNLVGGGTGLALGALDAAASMDSDNLMKDLKKADERSQEAMLKEILRLRQSIPKVSDEAVKLGDLTLAPEEKKLKFRALNRS